jgi:hypothetical protein
LAGLWYLRRGSLSAAADMCRFGGRFKTVSKAVLVAV